MWSFGTSACRAARTANSSKRIVSLSLPHYGPAPQQVTHVRDHHRVEDQRAELDGRKASTRLVNFDGSIDPAAQRGDPVDPAAREPYAVRLREAQRRTN